MNYNHYILIIVALILVFEASYDYLSKKFKSLPKREKFKFLPEKGGQRFFLYFIYLFPLIITVISPVKEKFNIFDSIKSNMSFYATALTITFTVFTFSFKLDKELELKEKEQEDKKDYYRPLFLIEKMENDANYKQVKLLMKNDSLYLEDIQVYNSENEIEKIDKLSLQSKDIVVKNITYPFYITGKTMIGEIILFAYLYGGEKLYKYLKYDKDPSIPNGIHKINLSEINEVWGTYNTRTKENNNILDILVFDNTIKLRREIKQKNFIIFKDSFSAETVNDFMKHIFNDLKNYCTGEHSSEYYNNVYNFLLEILDVIKDDMDLTCEINISSNPYNNLNLLAKKDSRSYKKLQNKFIDNNEFIKIILGIIASYENEPNKKIICSQVIDILVCAFKEIRVTDLMFDYFSLSKLKDDIYILKN